MTVDVVFDQWHDMMDSNHVTTAEYVFGGTLTRVSAFDPNLIQEVEGVVGGCRREPTQAPADFSFVLVSEDQDPQLARSVRDWAGSVSQVDPVYQSEIFSLWSDDSSWRWFDVHTDKAQVWCDLDQGRAAALIGRRAFDTPWLVGHYVFYPVWVQMLKSAGLFQTHAACVLDGDRSLLLPGPSGCGKSTLSINLVRNGFKFLSDDTVFLRDIGGSVVAQSVVEDIKVRKGTVDIFPELGYLCDHSGSRKRSKRQFAIDDVFSGSSYERPVVPKTVVFPRFTGEAETKLKPVKSATALSELLKFSLFIMDPYSREQHFQVLARLVEQARCYEAEVGADNDRSAYAIRMLLEEEGCLNDKEIECA